MKYSLAYGTLLGAVRDKGFIPWDDEIHIFMPRADYLRFMETYDSERYKQSFLFSDSKGMTLLPYGKVWDSKTKMDKIVNNSCPSIFIDIFPIDNLPDDMNSRKATKQIIRRLFQLKIIKDIRIKGRSSIIKALSVILLKALTFPITYKSILSRYNKLINKLNAKESNFKTDYNDYNNNNFVIGDNAFNTLESIPFENRFFLAFKEYDKILTMLYGNYMTLPPKEKQVTHHVYVAFIES